MSGYVSMYFLVAAIVSALAPKRLLAGLGFWQQYAASLTWGLIWPVLVTAAIRDGIQKGFRWDSGRRQ